MLNKTGGNLGWPWTIPTPSLPFRKAQGPPWTGPNSLAPFQESAGTTSLRLRGGSEQQRSQTPPLKTQKPSLSTRRSSNHQNEEVDRETVCSRYSAQRLRAGLHRVLGSQGLPGHRGGKYTAAQAHVRTEQINTLTISNGLGLLFLYIVTEHGPVYKRN